MIAFAIFVSILLLVVIAVTVCEHKDKKHPKCWHCNTELHKIDDKNWQCPRCGASYTE